MSKEMPALLIHKKIKELQSALFFPESNSPIKIPAHLVPSVQTDMEGQLWFIISRPAQYFDQDDSEFPCRLDFFKKGIGFHIKAKGKATLISQFSEIGFPVEGHDLKQRMEDNKVVAIKVKIQHTDYFEAPPERSNSRTQDTRKHLINRIFKN